MLYERQFPLKYNYFMIHCVNNLETGSNYIYGCVTGDDDRKLSLGRYWKVKSAEDDSVVVESFGEYG